VEPGVALVTGSGRRRLGWHVAQALGARGYRLALHYHRAAAEAAATCADWRQRGWQVEAFAADLTQEAQVQQLMAQVLDRFGRLDVLVTCAALWERKPLEDIRADDLRRHFEVNALGTFLCAQQAGLIMVRQAEGGCIVTLGDWAEVRPYPDYAAYFPSKGAVSALTRSLAVELALRNPHVRVNCLLPGPVLLPEDLPAEERQQAVQGTLLQREGRPEHIAQAVLFLIENDYITGVCLPVDGGRTLYPLEALGARLPRRTGPA
jgi:pteridine reductase